MRRAIAAIILLFSLSFTFGIPAAALTSGGFALRTPQTENRVTESSKTIIHCDDRSCRVQEIKVWERVVGRHVETHYAKPSLVAKARTYLGKTASQIGVRRNLWCAAFINKLLGGGTRSDLARSFARYGKPASYGCVGCIAVMARGRNGVSGHVGIVSGYRNGNPVLISGNHGGRVRESVYPKKRIFAWRYA